MMPPAINRLQVDSEGVAKFMPIVTVAMDRHCAAWAYGARGRRRPPWLWGHHFGHALAPAAALAALATHRPRRQPLLRPAPQAGPASAGAGRG